jgi:hypothetical protein
VAFVFPKAGMKNLCLIPDNPGGFIAHLRATKAEVKYNFKVKNRAEH